MHYSIGRSLSVELHDGSEMAQNPKNTIQHLIERSNPLNP